ncbi:MAG TPA: cation-transporting P-type ATPase, partial [Bauldia sp.]|nr:cation-transporting P-type ATPase [Bauldia sp.]
MSPSSEAFEPVGLSEAEARRRLATHGPNIIRRPSTRGFVEVVLGALREPMFVFLVAAAVLYLFLGDLAEGLFMTAGAAVTIGLVVIQETRSERSLAALQKIGEPFATVIRDRKERRIPVQHVVPGDLIVIAEGERLPADAALVAGDLLTVDESALTGESVPVTKEPASPPPAAMDAGAAGGDGTPFLYAGTLLVRGQGTAIVLATGPSTALGRIGAALATIASEPTPLQRTSKRLIARLGLFAVVFCLGIVVSYGLIRGDWVAGALAGITLAIALLPEEFPMVLAVFMALGSWRLARHRVL